MEKLINSKYKRESKIINAAHPRTFRDSTLVPDKDVLQVVYDVYSLIEADSSPSVPRVNLLFLHGSGMSRCIWEYYVAHLADCRLNWRIGKIVLMDQVTHGDSAVLNADKLGVNYDWVDGARDACKVAQNEFLDGVPAYNVVIGHSMGGFQALSCGILVPNLFQLILPIEPVALMYNAKGSNNEYTTIPKKFFKALSGKTKDHFNSESEYITFMRKGSFFPRVHSEILSRIIDFERIYLPGGEIKTKMEQRQNLLCYLTLFPGAKWLLGSLKFMKAPVVSIEGGISKWCPKENQETLKRLIPNYTRDKIPDGDHLLNIEMPDETLARILCHISRFIASQPPKDSTMDLNMDQRRGRFANEYALYCDLRVQDRPLELSKF